ncbi:hypothetical protein WJX73_003855 [Symbiochloris irregularis]|uniref:(S)-ureidoglycine aminohydrolase cupin domain-containing protein n=1 Tax=Symbiochloris irregularis TaxID=706552 RepID=A0AAW1PAH5_9CHLO
MATSPRAQATSPRACEAHLPLKVYHAPESLEELERFDSYEHDTWSTGKSKRWTFFNCTTSEMTLEIGGSERYYILEGEALVTYEGHDPVTLKAGDFVELYAGKAVFKVKKCVRMFFNEDGKTTYSGISLNNPE